MAPQVTRSWSTALTSNPQSRFSPRNWNLAARFIADGGTVQKLPPGLAVDFEFRCRFEGHVTNVKHCAAYGADGELLWVISSRPQPAWDNIPGGARYPDADLFGDARWAGKMHAAFERKYRRGLQWLDPWQSKPTQRFAVKFYNCGEDKSFAR